MTGKPRRDACPGEPDRQPCPVPRDVGAPTPNAWWTASVLLWQSLAGRRTTTARSAGSWLRRLAAGERCGVAVLLTEHRTKRDTRRLGPKVPEWAVASELATPSAAVADPQRPGVEAPGPGRSGFDAARSRSKVNLRGETWGWFTSDPPSASTTGRTYPGRSG